MSLSRRKPFSQFAWRGKVIFALPLIEELTTKSDHEPFFVPLILTGRYAAPEQYGRAQTTPRADIYSLGAILHQLLTGKDPSESPLRFVPLRRKNASGHSDPGSLTGSMVEIIMNSLGTLIDSMLEMDMNKRPASVAHIKQELHYLSTTWSEIVRGYCRPRVLPTSLPQTSTNSSLVGQG